MIEPSSVFAGSIQLFDDTGKAIEGWGSGQETIASYTPKEPLALGTTYTLRIMAGGVQDINGNTVEETMDISFTTFGEQ